MVSRGQSATDIEIHYADGEKRTASINDSKSLELWQYASLLGFLLQGLMLESHGRQTSKARLACDSVPPFSTLYLLLSYLWMHCMCTYYKAACSGDPPLNLQRSAVVRCTVFLNSKLIWASDLKSLCIMKTSAVCRPSLIFYSACGLICSQAKQILRLQCEPGWRKAALHFTLHP